MASMRPPAIHSRPVLGNAEAARGYSLASQWENTAALTDMQLVALDSIADKLSARPLPFHVVTLPARTSLPVDASSAPLSPRAADTAADAQYDSEQLEDAVLQNNNQFYKWIAELEAAKTNETEAKYQEYASTLQAHLQQSELVLSKVEETLQLFELLKDQHGSVSAKTKALHDSCEKMVRDKQTLVEFADALRSKLSHFEELDSLQADITRAKTQQDGNHFLPLLQRLDDSISYMTTTSPQVGDTAVSKSPLLKYVESNVYAAKYRQLQAQAMAALQQRVAAVLRQSYDKVVEAARAEAGPSSSTNGRLSGRMDSGSFSKAIAAIPPGAEPAVLVVKFRAVAEAGLKGLLQGLEARSSRPEYQRLLQKCLSMYCEVRLQLMSPVVQQRVREYGKEAMPQLIRNGCAYLIQVSQLEHQLFDQLFPSLAAEPGSLATLMEPLCMLLYDQVRPKVVTLQSIDDLCELVEILQTEVLQEQLARRGDACAPVRQVVQRMLADVQSRLTFKGQSLIRESVLHYRPTPEELDFPALLRNGQTNGHINGHAGPNSQQDEGEVSEAAPLREQQAGTSTSGAWGTSQGLYFGWYRPVQNALLYLSKLYGALDPQVFGGLAQDAVLSAAAAISTASTVIAKHSGLIDGYLFQIKQLLILREQLAPFNATFATTEKELDFSHMRDHLRRIVIGQASLFSLSMDNALLQFARQGSLIREAQVDSKRQLELQLKDTCERFIVAVTKTVVEPMLSFITVVTAVRAPQEAGQGTQPQPPLREQAFASVEKLTEMVEKVKQALHENMPEMVDKMKLYLHSPSTHAILFKPIKSNIAEAHAQIAALLEAEYTEEEREQVGLTEPQELQQIMDALC